MINAHSIKMVMQKARRRISAFQKAFKQGKLNKKSYEKSKESNILDLQEYLKTSNKKFRRYNRKIGMYEPITPRGKLKQSSEFEQFVLDINQFMNETRTAKEEIKRKEMKLTSVTTASICPKKSSFVKYLAFVFSIRTIFSFPTRLSCNKLSPTSTA